MGWTRIGVGLVAAVIAVGSGSAAAAPVAPGRPLTAAAPVLPVAQSTNPDFAGFLGFISPTGDRVETTFRVPALTCTQRNRIIIVEAGVNSNSRASRYAYAGIEVACYRGREDYSALIDFAGDRTVSSHRVKAGDRITLRTAQTLEGFYTDLSVYDRTEGWTFKQRDAGVDTVTFPIVLEVLQQFRGQSGRAEVPVFRDIVFTHTYADGLALAHYPFSPITMASHGVVQITTDYSVPRSSTGFTSVFHHT